MTKGLNKRLFAHLFILFGLTTWFLIQTPITITAADVADRITLKMGSPIISINEIEKDQGIIPIIKDGVVLIPIRPVFEALSVDMEWDSETNTLTAIRGTDRIKLTIGENIAYKNEMLIKLETPPVIIKGFTMLPVNFIAEILGADIKWVSETTIINITEDGILEAVSVERPTVMSGVPSMKTSSEVQSYQIDINRNVTNVSLEVDGELIGFGVASRSGGDFDYNGVREKPSLAMEPERITLSWGEDNSYVIHNWITDISVMGKLEKKTVWLIYNNDDGTPKAVWKIVNAWPISCAFVERRGSNGSNYMAVNNLVLSYESMIREK